MGAMMQELTLPQTITQIQELIDNGQGDAGRLNHILESLQKNKKLYNSDENYLTEKLQAKFTRYAPEPQTQENPLS